MINNRVAEQIIRDILLVEMAMPADDVVLADMNWKIPDDEGLKITVRFSDGQPFSSNNKVEERAGILYETNSVQMRENIQIDIMSRSEKALMRKWEVVAALSSIYAQQLQEEGYFRIFSIPQSFLNTSAAEGGSQLARYTITIACFTWYQKEKPLGTKYPAGNYPYFDKFPARGDTDKTIGTPTGILEFDTPEEQ